MAQKEEVLPPIDSVAVSRRYLLRVTDLPESEAMVNQVLSLSGQINSFRVDVSPESTRFEKICSVYIGADLIHFCVMVHSS